METAKTYELAPNNKPTAELNSELTKFGFRLPDRTIVSATSHHFESEIEAHNGAFSIITAKSFNNRNIVFMLPNEKANGSNVLRFARDTALNFLKVTRGMQHVDFVPILNGIPFKAIDLQGIYSVLQTNSHDVVTKSDNVFFGLDNTVLGGMFLGLMGKISNHPVIFYDRRDIATYKLSRDLSLHLIGAWEKPSSNSSDQEVQEG